MATYYRQETYQNGILISTTYIDKDGNPKPSGFAPTTNDIISSSPPPFLPNYSAFDSSIRANTSYANATNNIISTLTSNLAISAYRNTIDYLIFNSLLYGSVDSTNLYSLLISRWNVLPPLFVILNRPTASDIAAWNVIAAANLMPFVYVAGGTVQSIA